jgi:DNA (cytosine-5)-methyltransferase 1
VTLLDDGRIVAADAVSAQDRPLTVVDLFAGAGGLSEGFQQAGFKIVAGTDHDPDAAATYARNFPNAQTIIGDVREPALREQILEAARGVDVLIGGPPCQAYSQVRNHSRLIDDPRNSLYREFVQTVADARPSAFVMENVPGLAQMGVQDQVAEDLALDGEYLVRPQLVDAADFGVPQTRKRLVFLGVHHSLATSAPVIVGSGATRLLQLSRLESEAPGYQVRARSDLGSDLLNRLADPQDLTAVTAEQAIGDLRALEIGRRDETLDALPAATSAFQRQMRQRRSRPVQNVSVPRSQADTVQRLLGIPAGGNHLDLSEDLRGRYLSGQKWGPHNGTGLMSRRHYYAYRRLHPAIWAWTLNTKGDSVYHYAEARCLSVREFARLQSFPDKFVFAVDPRRGPIPGRIGGGAAHSRYRQVGNAVPPLLAAAAAREIKALLGEHVRARPA